MEYTAFSHMISDKSQYMCLDISQTMAIIQLDRFDNVAYTWMGLVFRGGGRWEKTTCTALLISTIVCHAMCLHLTYKNFDYI